MRYLLCLGLVAVTLTGCLNVETSVDLKRDGSGQINLVYEIDSDLYRLGVFDNSDAALPIPVSRDEFVRTAREIDGLRLRRYRVREDVGTVTVSVRMSFDSIDAINAWYSGSTGSAISLTMESNGGTWTQILAPGNGTTGEVASALGETLSDYELRFSLNPPGRPTSVNLGEIESARASVAIGLDEIVAARQPIVWQVQW